jgi:hypothetical protein
VADTAAHLSSQMVLIQVGKALYSFLSLFSFHFDAPVVAKGTLIQVGSRLNTYVRLCLSLLVFSFSPVVANGTLIQVGSRFNTYVRLCLSLLVFPSHLSLQMVLIQVGLITHGSRLCYLLFAFAFTFYLSSFPFQVKHRSVKDARGPNHICFCQCLFQKLTLSFFLFLSFRLFQVKHRSVKGARGGDVVIGEAFVPVADLQRRQQRMPQWYNLGRGVDGRDSAGQVGLH